MIDKTTSQLSAVELRREFDEAFAQPLTALGGDTVELLAIRAGGAAYALRVLEVSGVFLRTKVVPVPSENSALLGLAGVRGVIVPVYSLAAMLGHPLSPEPPRWLALCAGALPVALGFDALEGHLRVAPTELRTVGDAPLAQHIQLVVQTPAGARALIDIPSVVKLIAGRSSP